MGNYVGFYTSRPFWAGEALELSASHTLENFTQLMSEEVRVYEEDEYVLKICKDGCFLFQIKAVSEKLDARRRFNAIPNLEDELAIWSSYLNYLNCIYILFESSFLKHQQHAYFEIAEITNRDAFGTSFENNKQMGSSISQLSFVSGFQMGRYLSDYKQDIPLIMDLRIAGRIEVPFVVFDALHSDFSKIYGHAEHIRVLSEVIKSLGEYKVANYSTSLVLSWFVIESYIREYWQKLLTDKNMTFRDGSKRINSDRFENFQGRDYPISVVLNVLELSDIIDFEQFKTIDALRKTRNALVHRDQQAICNANDCQQAFKIIKMFIAKETGVDLEMNLSYSLRGL